ncbi:MAG: NAD(P)/FAD-dependent oxidoreductase [Pseudomonadota bacterium]|nr:NAD(P)/FAD-dependent oxidoreductase [Pseudomonadota bacterium]
MQTDVLIVGGGPAGLSAALVFGRARKRVLLCDAGTPRNAAAVGIHNFITRDGVSPRDFRAAAHADLGAYPSVETRAVGVVDVVRAGDRLSVTLEDGTTVSARRVLLATGVVDVPPDVPGLAEAWGTSAFQCPYCHGWEVRDRAWGVLASTDAVASWSLVLRGWTANLVLYTDGASLSADTSAKLDAAGVPVETTKIARLHSEAGHVHHVELADGRTRPCDALFLHPAQRPTALVVRMGLELSEAGLVRVDDQKQSSMPGVHVAGDAAAHPQGAVMAASAGVFAAAMMNHALTLDDVAGRLR